MKIFGHCMRIIYKFNLKPIEIVVCLVGFIVYFNMASWKFIILLFEKWRKTFFLLLPENRYFRRKSRKTIYIFLTDGHKILF